MLYVIISQNEVSGGGGEEKVKLNVTLVNRVKMGCSGEGEHYGPCSLHIMDWEWEG